MPTAKFELIYSNGTGRLWVRGMWVADFYEQKDGRVRIDYREGPSVWHPTISSAVAAALHVTLDDTHD